VNAFLSKHLNFLIIGAAFVGYVILAVELARVRPPNFDDGNFGNAAAIFASKGFLAMPMKNNVWLPGLDEHLYANMPLYFLGLGAWFKAFGVDIVTMRLFSVIWGAIALAAWYLIVRRLTPNRGIALLSLVLIGLNYDYADLTADRYDIMCAALNALGLAAYLYLRERHFDLALAVANALVAASFLTHPYGFMGFLGLAVFVIALDRGRLRWKQLLISAAPYVAALAGWGAYIARAPAVFRSQFFANTAPRLPHFDLIAGLRQEVVHRYVVLMAGWRPDVPIYMRVKTLILVAIAAGIAGCLLTPSIRRDRNYRLLLILTGLWFLVLTYLEPLKTYNFMIHILPIYFVLLAIWLGALIERGGILRLFALACVSMLVLFAFVSVGYRVRLNSYRQAFLPAMSFLRRQVNGNEVVMAPGEFGFGLGFDRHVIDDISLGYESGRSPDFIVIDSEYQQDQALLPDSAVRDHIRTILSNYRLVFASQAGYDFYKVYARATG
jgi:hypothetical protein